MEDDSQLCLLVVEVDGQLCQQLEDDSQLFQLEEGDGELQKVEGVGQLCQLEMMNSDLLIAWLHCCYYYQPLLL